MASVAQLVKNAPGGPDIWNALLGPAIVVIGVDPKTLVNPAWIEVAVMVAVPTPEEVNTPAEVIVPPVADHVTPVLKAPVPWTVAEQLDV